MNPADLAQTAALLEDAAGEYQAIGTQVARCDCGCMPADVAAVVDSVTADVRAGLAGVAGGVSEQAADLAWRAGIDQNASTGYGTTVTIGGDYSSPAITEVAGSGPVTVTIGGGYDNYIFDPGAFGSQTVVIGGGYPTIGEELPSAPVTVTIGSNYGAAVSETGGWAGPQTVVLGGGFVPQSFDGGEGAWVTIGGGPEIPPTFNLQAAILDLMATTQVQNDPLASSIFWNLIQSDQRYRGVFTHAIGSGNEG